MATLPKVITYEEWLEMPVVEDRLEEVVEGEVRFMPPNKVPHARIIRALTAAFLRQLDFRKTECLSSTFGLVIRTEPLVCRSPDIAIFELATMVEKDGYLHSAPQLIVEVLSPSESRKEIRAKLDDYESLGVPEVWLVSPEACTVELLQLEDGKLSRTALVAEGILQPKHFPGVKVDIAEIWPA